MVPGTILAMTVLCRQAGSKLAANATIWKILGKWLLAGRTRTAMVLPCSSGDLLKGWINDGGTWYYSNNEGVMQTGWLTDAGGKYYLRGSGAWQLAGDS